MVTKNKKVAIAMSGGVDSSVCAVLLKNEGYDVVGVTGKMVNSCAAEQIIKNAQDVADQLDIKLHVVDMCDEFEQNVINYFKSSYAKGYTPNPCAVCNKKIKWGKLFDYAINELGADLFATGHYAQIRDFDGIKKLYPAKDPRKDQLYFLFELNQHQLAKTIFPLYKYEKSQIREIAHQNDLPSKSSKDSQDVCFIQPPQNMKMYLTENLGRKNGDFLHIKSGKKLGEHNGCYQFTIGQRKGIGVSYSEPLYVIDLDAEKNIVYLGEKPEAMRDSLILENVSHSYPLKQTSFDVLTKIRYNMQAVQAHVEIFGDTAEMKFCNPVYSITPGQAAVWYDLDDGHLLGGGWIK